MGIFLSIGLLAVLPNLALTPGAVRTTDKAAICSTRTGTVRNVSVATRKKVFAAYGVRWERRAQFETDHLVSLEIGGSNVVANLWPQPYAGIGAHSKDILENKLHAMICRGEISPSEAQKEIASDWYKAYKRYVKKADGKLGR